MVTGWAVVFGSSTFWATRISMGLSVIPRSRWTPGDVSKDACDRGLEEEELVLFESFLESFRKLAASWERFECFLRSTFRGWPALVASGKFPVLEEATAGCVTDRGAAASLSPRTGCVW